MKWINIKEQMPEKEGHYLFCYILRGKKQTIPGYIKIEKLTKRSKNQYIFCDAEFEEIDLFDGQITHWMLYPEPPE